MIKQYTSPNVIIIAIMLLDVFKNIKLSNAMKKIFKTLSFTSFGVYIIHAHPFVWDKLVGDSFSVLDNYNFILGIFGVVLSCITIYLICSIIDYGRSYLFKVLHIDKFADYLGAKLDNILSLQENNH